MLVVDWRVTFDLEMMWMEVVTANFVGCSNMFVNLNVESSGLSSPLCFMQMRVGRSVKTTAETCRHRRTNKLCYLALRLPNLFFNFSTSSM